MTPPRRPRRSLLDGLALRVRRAGPLELRILGRTLLHAALVGSLAGLVGAAFFAALEIAQRQLLEVLAGYVPLRAQGETFLAPEGGHPFRPWLLALLPAVGGLVSGLLTRLAPETAGGGGDAAIEAYHRHGGLVRRRVLPVKAAAAIATLASGGSGGREGPTMQIGAALGSLVARVLPVSARERHVLLVAGIAAGISAVFRTPLGAALLAVEMMYRDDFEADALVPAILASVVAYSVVIALYGEATLFGDLPRFRFVPAQLPLFALLALAEALAAVAFVALLRAVQRAAARLPGPAWARPGLGGLAMGLVGVGVLVALGPRLAAAGSGHGLGVFGGGYGAAQLALRGGAGLGAGWGLVGVLALVAAAKLVASALTIGSGAAAGDFAPSLVMGALVGAAFGEAMQLLLGDPRIAPGAFALVGMGTFYGGVAHAPLSALVLVAELAGSYDLLVPMMLSIAVAFVALRRWSLYPAQPETHRESPLHRAAAPPSALARLSAGDVAAPVEVESVPAGAPFAALARLVGAARRQLVFPVVASGGARVGLVEAGSLREAAGGDGEAAWAVAADLMAPFVAVAPDATLAEVARRLADAELRQVPVVDGERLVGFVGEAEIMRALVAAADASA
ncbi:MAG: chloride channel protein [Anaeromyxobacteraceae bacterium]